MSNLTYNLDEDCYPDWDWSADSLLAYQEMYGEYGILINDDHHKNRHSKHYSTPAISFSGFHSQGDGLAFDAVIQWVPFFEKHSSLKTEYLNWYLLLSANPDYVFGGTKRSNRSNNMTVDISIEAPEVIENGFFAGMRCDLEELGCDWRALEEMVKDICESAADRMYRELEEEYESICEGMKQDRIDAIIEENQVHLAPMLETVDVLGTFTKAQANQIWADDEADFSDMVELDLVVHVGAGEYQVSISGKKLIREAQSCVKL